MTQRNASWRTTGKPRNDCTENTVNRGNIPAPRDFVEKSVGTCARSVRGKPPFSVSHALGPRTGPTPPLPGLSPAQSGGEGEVHLMGSMHSDLEPTPNPSQEGNWPRRPAPLLGGVRGGFVGDRFMESLGGLREVANL